MASTLSSTQADPRFDGDAAPAVWKDPLTEVEEALARLVHASYPPDARAREPAFDRSGDARISRSFDEATLGAAEPRPEIPREQGSLGKRGFLARAAIAVCLGVLAIWAWRSDGGMVATSAPAERRQIETLADLAALRRTIEQLTAGQEQLAREIARLQAEKPQVHKPPAEKPDKADKRALHRVSAPHPPPVAGPMRKPAPL